VQPRNWVWFDNQLIPWTDATIHVSCHSLHYGLALLEGTRGYPQEAGGVALFRLADHLRRLADSARILQITIPFSIDDLMTATLTLVSRNAIRRCYVRHLVFLGAGNLTPRPASNPVHVVILCWSLDDYLRRENPNRGISCKVSSFSHHFGNAVMTKAKVSGHYVNAILALNDIGSLRVDEAIMLDSTGCVTEATGHNVFLVRKGLIKTPPLSSALEGITRDTVIQLAEHDKLPVREAPITRDDLYVADEVFLTGTAGEIVPVGEIDGRSVGLGTVGPITRRLSDLYTATTAGNYPAFHKWLVPVQEGLES